MERIVTFLGVPSDAPDTFDWRAYDLSGVLDRPVTLSMAVGGVPLVPPTVYRVVDLTPVDDGRRLRLIAERPDLEEVV